MATGKVWQAGWLTRSPRHNKCGGNLGHRFLRVLLIPFPVDESNMSRSMHFLQAFSSRFLHHVLPDKNRFTRSILCRGPIQIGMSKGARPMISSRCQKLIVLVMRRHYCCQFCQLEGQSYGKKIRLNNGLENAV